MRDPTTAPNVSKRVIDTDRREVAEAFRKRLDRLLASRGDNLSSFADQIGVDRSAMSQFMTKGSTRLPRAETLCTMAVTCGVSVDWLLGLTGDEEPASTAPLIELIDTNREIDRDILDEWHRRALGYKIRYVPSSLPDLLRTEAVTQHLYAVRDADARARREENARAQLAFTRRPETDIEACMPFQRLENLADGTGLFAGLSVETRLEQLHRIAALCTELYPTFRLFLYDERQIHVSPYTVFGPHHAAIYLGGLYLSISAREQIARLSRHFDGLIRIAITGPDQIADHVNELGDHLISAAHLQEDG